MTSTKSKLEDLKEVIQLMINRGTVTVSVVRKVLDIPAKIFENTDAVPTLQKIADLLDVNGDKKYTSEDFILLKQQLQKGDLGLYLSMISILSGLVHTASQLHKLNLSSDEIIDISIRLILYSILIPVMSCENIADWAKATAIESSGKTNLEYLFDLLEIIYDTLVSSYKVKSAVDTVINYIGKRWCSCCSTLSDKSARITNQNLPAVEHQVLTIMKAKNASSVQGVPIVEQPRQEQITVAHVDEPVTSATPPSQSQSQSQSSNTLVIPITVPASGDKFVVTIPSSTVASPAETVQTS